MRNNHRHFVLAVALLGLAVVPTLAEEAKLIAVLKSGASVEEKSTACRELAREATQQSVPALAALLGDEKLSHMARYALETIADPSVDQALRDALGKLSGRPLQGVIGSLGVRRDGQAVDAIASRLAGPDAAVAQSAARALGNIGTPQAAKALEAALAGASGAQQLAVVEGLLRAAEALSAEGQSPAAQAIYDRLRGLDKAPQQVRVAALRGAILSRGPAGIPLMLDAIRGSDWVLTAVAARAAMELKGTEVTVALCDELAKLPADKQVLLINALGYRRDASAGPAVLAVAANAPEAVRLAAVQNLTHLSYTPVLPLLAELALAGESELAEAARDCLANFPAKAADGRILAMLAHQDAKVRRLAVEMIGQRSIAGSTANLLKATADADETVRITAVKTLRDQAGAAELPALLKALVHARSSAEVQAAENAVSVVCSRQSGPASANVVIVKAEYGDLPAGSIADVTAKVTAMVKGGAAAVEASNGNFGDPASRRVKKLRVDYRVHDALLSKTVPEGETLVFTATATPPAIVDAVCNALAGAQGEPKLALLRTLRSAGGPKALATVQAATTDRDPQVKDTALRVLVDWPTPDALPSVAGLLKQPPTKTMKVLALRGFVRLVPQDAAPEAKKVESLREAMALADRDQEKQLVLSALGNVATADALTLVASHFENPALKEEACLAAVTIAERLAGHAEQRVAVMKQVAKTTTNKKLAARANLIARQAQK